MFTIFNRKTKKGSSRKARKDYHLRRTNFRPRMETLETRTMMAGPGSPVAHLAGTHLVESAGLSKSAMVASPVAGQAAAQVAKPVQSKVNSPGTNPSVLGTPAPSAIAIAVRPGSVSANKVALKPAGYTAASYTVGDYVAANLRANLGRRIGNNCVDPVVWALRVSGAKCQGMGEWPYAGDCVWGTYLNCFFVGKTDHSRILSGNRRVWQ
jgi:hypothetical protein